MSDKKYPVMMTRKEIEMINSIIDSYLDYCVANRYTIYDSDVLLPLNLGLRYRISEIKEEEALAKLTNKGIEE